MGGAGRAGVVSNRSVSCVCTHMDYCSDDYYYYDEQEDDPYYSRADESYYTSTPIVREMFHKALQYFRDFPLREHETEADYEEMMYNFLRIPWDRRGQDRTSTYVRDTFHAMRDIEEKAPK